MDLLQALPPRSLPFILIVVAIALSVHNIRSKSRWGNLNRCHKDVSPFKLVNGKKISQENRAKYGSIYMQRSGFQYEVVLTTPDQLKQYFSSHAKDHRKLDSFGAGQYLVALLGECLGFQNGNLWVQMRKLFNVHFTHAMAVKTLPAIYTHIFNWVRLYEGKKEFEVDPFAFVSDIPFTCVAKYLYGGEICSGKTLERLKSLVPLHSGLMAFAFTTFFGRFKLFQYLPVKKMKELRYFQDQFSELSIGMVEAAKKENTNTVAGDLYQLVEAGLLTYANWVQTLDEILFANIDVTATVMAWSLVEMAQNPQEQQDLRNEINNLDGPLEDFCKRTDTYLHQVLLEILRLHPLLWYSFPELSPHQMIIDGYKIRPNTPIVFDQYQLNYHSPAWNPQSKQNFGQKFAPERFAGLQNRDVNLSNVTFGSGPRRCLGKNFAEIMIKVELAVVLQNFVVLLRGPVKTAENTFVVQPDTTLKLERVVLS